MVDMSSTLRPYWIAIPTADRKAFAARCGTTEPHLRNVAYGKSCSPELASAIERETFGSVTRADLRPSDWWKIWPELHAVYPHLLPQSSDQKEAA